MLAGVMLGRFAGVLVALPIAFVGCGGRVGVEADQGMGGASGAGTGGTKAGGGTKAFGGAPVAGTPGSGGWLAGGTGFGGAPNFGGGFGKGGTGQGGASPGGAPSRGGAPSGGTSGGFTSGGFTSGGFTSGGFGTGGTTAVCPPCRGYEPGSCSWEYCDLTSRKCLPITLDGLTCDDRDFCTVGETCRAGRCQGGSLNTCGITPNGCSNVTCNPGGFCTQSPSAPEGAPCKTGDLCEAKAYCSKGTCISVPRDCGGTPLPDQCYQAECNPSTGQCEAVPISDTPCKIPGDRCVQTAYCFSGICYPDTTTSCGALDTQCSYGECDPMTGGCVSRNYPNGSGCFVSPCTQNDSCQGGVCKPGTPVTRCVSGDGCCPSNCTSTDTDCFSSVPFAAMNRGWWNSSGDHDATNDNTFTGSLVLGYNSYFTFDLRSLNQSVQSALLLLEFESFYGPDSSEQISLWDVSTDAVTLEAYGRGNTAIYKDLQTGNSYGTAIASKSEAGTTLGIALGPQAIADINAFRGKFFSIGVHIDSLSSNPPDAGEGVRFSESNENRVHQLQLR